MTPEQFCYWLQGYTELNGDTPTKEQWVLVQKHLQTVFTKITPTLLDLKLQDTKTQSIC